MPLPITAKVFQAALDKQRYPEQDVKSAKRLVNEADEFCFTGIHKVDQHHIPAMYLRLSKKASQWARQKNGVPHQPDFKFNAMTDEGGNIGFECILGFPNKRNVHLFFNPADKAVQNFLRLLAKSEIVAFSFFLHGGDMVYASYVSSDPDIQDWAKRNLVLAKSCAADNTIESVIKARLNMFWLKRKPAFVLGR